MISWHKLSLEPYQNSFSVYFGAASRNIGRLYSDREQRSGDELGCTTKDGAQADYPSRQEVKNNAETHGVLRWKLPRLLTRDPILSSSTRSRANRLG